jgi:N-acetylglucosamine transport system substrate-binding protein
VEISDTLKSAITLFDNAGDEIFSDRYYLAGWYGDLKAEAKDRMGDLLTKRISVDEFIEAVQKKADEVKADPDIPKYRREA